MGIASASSCCYGANTTPTIYALSIVPILIVCELIVSSLYGCPAKSYVAMSTNIRGLFGKRIRALRKKLRLSQEMLAERCDLHATYIGGIERGLRNVSLINIVRIARGLKVKPGELFRGIR